jgi:hypothetical protein
MLPIGKEVHAGVSLEASHSFQGSLLARLYDNYGRLVSRRKYNNISFSKKKSWRLMLPSSGVMSKLAKVDVILKDTAGNQVDRQVKELLFLQPRNWDDYQFV